MYRLLTGPGQGVLDYRLCLRLLAQLGRPTHPIIEHLSLGDVPREREYAIGKMDRL